MLDLRASMKSLPDFLKVKRKKRDDELDTMFEFEEEMKKAGGC